MNKFSLKVCVTIMCIMIGYAWAASAYLPTILELRKQLEEKMTITLHCDFCGKEVIFAEVNKEDLTNGYIVCCEECVDGWENTPNSEEEEK